MRPAVLICSLSVLPAVAAQAQHEHQPSPYAGQELTAIPALTAQELADLREGAGMGFARAAELNHFPGPKHVLELADELALTADQRARVRAILEVMQGRAVALGEQIIEAERILNTRFRHAHIDSTSLRTMTADVARLYGELRATHLQAHLATSAVLSEDQVAAYDRLRGYAGRERPPDR